MVNEATGRNWDNHVGWIWPMRLMYRPVEVEWNMRPDMLVLLRLRFGV